MEILFLWAGLLFAAFGIVIVRSALADQAGGRICDGEVIGYKARMDRSGPKTFAPVVVYRDRFERRFTIESPLAGGNLPYTVGQRVRVLVTPGDPPRGRVAGNGIIWFGAIVAAIGLFLTILFFSIFRWTLLSVAVAAAVSFALAMQWQRSKSKFPLLGELLQKVRQATTGAATPESEFDRASLVPPAELRAMSRSQPRQALVAAVLMLLIAAGCITWSVIWTERRSRFLTRAVAAEGVVVQMARSSGSDTTTWAPVVEFTPQGASSRVRFKHAVSSSHPSWSVGDRVRVLHDPFDPQNAMIDSSFWNRAAPLTPAAAGALLAILGLASLRSAMRTSRPGGPSDF